MRCAHVVAVYAVVLVICSIPSIAKGYEEKLSSEDIIFFHQIQRAVQCNDRTWVASHVFFPLNFRKNGVIIFIKTRNKFLRNYENIMSAEVLRVITTQRPERLFKNYQGVMIGNGEVWFGQRRSSSGTTGFWKYQIIAINN